MDKIDYTLDNQWWELEVQQKDNENFAYKLYSKKNGVTYADQDYHYSIITSNHRY